MYVQKENKLRKYQPFELTCTTKLGLSVFSPSSHVVKKVNLAPEPFSPARNGFKALRTEIIRSSYSPLYTSATLVAEGRGGVGGRQ